MKRTTLRDAREKRGWTQEQLEQESGVAQTTISRIESGDTANPSYGTVRSLEVALGLRPGSLILGTGDAIQARAS